MRTDPFVGNPATLVAVVELPHEHRLDAEVWELPEDFVGGIWAIVVADPGVVTSDSNLGAAEVLPHDCVHDGLLGTGVLHLIVEDAHDCRVLRVVVPEECLVRVHYHLVAKVAWLLLAQDRVDEEALSPK